MRTRTACAMLNAVTRRDPLSKTRIYVAGPMTGIRRKNYSQFNWAAWLLRQVGYEIINPWELDWADTTRTTWEEFLQRDIAALMTCSGIATLANWKKSRGARLEVYIAKALKWPVHPVAYWRNLAIYQSGSKTNAGGGKKPNTSRGVDLRPI